MRSQFVFGLVLMSLVACNKEDDGEETGTPTTTTDPTTTTTTTTTMTGQSMVRAIHLSPDAPAVDLFANGSAVLSDLAFTESSAYLSVPEGTYTFDVVPMGGAVSDSVLTVADLPLMADMKYTAVAFDNLAAIQALALVDDDTNIPAGSTRFQVVHAAAGVGQVDVWDMGSGTPLIPDFDFGATVQADLSCGVGAASQHELTARRCTPQTRLQTGSPELEVVPTCKRATLCQFDRRTR